MEAQIVDTILLGTRLLLFSVFAIAGIMKFLDQTGTRQNLQDFGVPRVLTAPVGFCLPLAEVTVALTLIPLASAWWGGLGALAERPR